ncbi:MAG: class I SAM-dependent methyltransferase [Candidatus Schekmanbacteria bacterium]|nr:class I SAM-dependent methyltransferase [Candidatus Schekmanbacteria bacterium]
MEEGQGAFELRLDFRSKKHENFCVDVYTLGQPIHPEHHLGYWILPLDRKVYDGVVQLDFREVNASSVKFHLDRVDGATGGGAGETLVSSDYWANPACRYAPVRDLMLVTRDRHLAIAENVHVVLKDDDPAKLVGFYQRLHSDHEYQEATGTNPFLVTLHESKMRILERLFARHFAATGSKRIADVGCGRCLLSEMGKTWPFQVFAVDFGEGVLRERKAETPSNYHWAAGDAGRLPFGDETCDGLFAGEVIEHVSEPRVTLEEWRRVLRPGGVMIITTPNVERLSNRMSKARIPFAPDHLSEVSYRELVQLISGARLELLALEGFYLELLLRKVAGGQYVDRLQLEWNLPEKIPWMRRLGQLGHAVPALSFGLVAVARRPGARTDGTVAGRDRSSGDGRVDAA